MPRLITCDDVFEILTRGPFPTGHAEDDIVETHLLGCHECRQMAEALRPAVGLLHESLEEPGLPMYGGAEGPPPESPPWHHEGVLPSIGRPPRKLMSPNRSRLVASVARLVAAGLLIATMIGAATLIASFRQPAAPPMQATLFSAPLPEQCRLALFQGSGSNPLREGCCSTCHQANQVEQATVAPVTGLVTTSCQACHE